MKKITWVLVFELICISGFNAQESSVGDLIEKWRSDDIKVRADATNELLYNIGEFGVAEISALENALADLLLSKSIGRHSTVVIGAEGKVSVR